MSQNPANDTQGISPKVTVGAGAGVAGFGLGATIIGVAQQVGAFAGVATTGRELVAAVVVGVLTVTGHLVGGYLAPKERAVYQKAADVIHVLDPDVTADSVQRAVSPVLSRLPGLIEDAVAKHFGGALAQAQQVVSQLDGAAPGVGASPPAAAPVPATIAPTGQPVSDAVTVGDDPVLAN